MADIKISQLGAAAAINDSQVVAIVDNGSTVKGTMAQIKDYSAGGLSNLDTQSKTSPVSAINETLGVAETGHPLQISLSAISALPTTVNAAEITADMVCQPGGCYLSSPAAQTGDWTVTTAAGSVTLSGTISGTTDITLYLTVPRTPA
jgi:hypothetical protein